MGQLGLGSNARHIGRSLTMKVGIRSKGLRGLFVAVILAALAAGFFLMPTAPPPSLPSTSLTFLGLTNLSPIGTMTAFGVSNGSPHQLVYYPRMVEYRAATGRVVVDPNLIVNRVGVVGPGQTYAFFVPGAVTNHSLRVQVMARSKAEPEGLFMKVEHLVRKVSSGKAEAWLGKRHRGTLIEASP
jgi:hypothetical protein